MYKCVQYTSHCHKFQFSLSIHTYIYIYIYIHIYITQTIQHNMQYCFAVDTQLHLPQILTNISTLSSCTFGSTVFTIQDHMSFIRITRLSFISHYNNPINCSQTLNLNFFLTFLTNKLNLIGLLIIISSQNSKIVKLSGLSSYAIFLKNVFSGEISVLHLFNFKNIH